MEHHESRTAMEKELRGLETDLAELRKSAARIRREIGQRSDGAIDVNERASLMTEAEQQEELAENLEARRDKLRHELGLE